MFQPPPAKYGGRHTVTLIPGDGIGPELLSHVREVFRLVRLKLNPIQIVKQISEGCLITMWFVIHVVGSAVCRWTLRWCMSTLLWRRRMISIMPSLPSAVMELPSKASEPPFFFFLCHEQSMKT